MPWPSEEKYFPSLHTWICSIIEQVLEATSQKAAAVQPPTFLKPYKSNEEDMRDTAGEAKTFSIEPLHTDEHVVDNQHEHIYNSSVRTQDVVWRTCWKRWTTETNGERESKGNLC